MNLRQTVKNAISLIRHPASWGRSALQRARALVAACYGMFSSSRVDFEVAAGPLHLNPVVAAATAWIEDNFGQAEFQLVERNGTDSTEEPIWEDPLLDLIRRPNPFLSTEDLFAKVIVDLLLHGNAYWIKARAYEGGPVLELWPEEPWRMEPRWAPDGSEWIGYWERNVDGRIEIHAVEDVVHFRIGSDPENPRLGLSRLAAGLPVVAAYNESITYTYAILKNMGVPSVIFSRRGGDNTPEIGDDNARLLKERYGDESGGDNRGNAVVIDTDLQVHTPGVTPEQMRLHELPKQLESVISALLGPSPIVTGLPSAADHATYANSDNAYERAWSRLQAWGRRICGAIDTQLLPDFVQDTARLKRLSTRFDYANVAALAQDQGEVAERAMRLFGTATAPGLIKRDEGREMLGLEPEDDEEFGEVYADGTGPGAPEPEPAPAMPAPGLPVADASPGGDGASEFTPKAEKDDPFPAAKAHTNGKASGWY